MDNDAATFYAGGALMLGIVERGRGERLIGAAKRAGARGGTVVLGRGTADGGLLAMLGVGDSEQDLVLVLAGDLEADAIVAGIRADHARSGRRRGVLAVLDVVGILRHRLAVPADLSAPAAVKLPAAEPRRTSMEKAAFRLISFIVNQGFADDAMAAARRAGASGGTIVAARGTGKEEDVKFFGIALVPEKDLLVIVVEEAKAEAILEAVRSLPCLSEPGSGIAFSLPVRDFFSLGRPAG
jgi:nitrogen regulatory protein PII